ncbi:MULTISPECIES: globin domain-containing protein [unclassified Streptomyces]|uniref:globin domain-containing protein n=1 Tax=unclassified Streptomyces TaxID=2593676 RepID=UPI000364C060|nr:MULTISPECIES: globin domain-containing protein [unclassified Streptomyces]MYT32417.1 flavohemoprotein [Streptomyces sp. SID8354]
MDAPTTTSADSGSSGGSSGEWGWFTPSAKKSSGDQPDRNDGQDGQDRQRAPQGDHDEPGGHAETDRIPSRPVNPIRPVGTAAERGREQEPQRVPRQGPQPGQEALGRSGAGPAERPAPAAPQAAAPQAGTEPEPVHEPAARTPFDAFGLVGPVTPPADSAPSAPPAPSAPSGPAAHEGASAPARPFVPAASPAPRTQPAQAAPSAPPAPPPATAPPAPPAATATATPAPPAPAASLAALAASGPPEAAASPDAVLIRRTMAEVEPVADRVTSYFYALLFVQHPELRALFPASMDAQRDRLFKALLTAAQHVDNSEVLGQYLSQLGRGHRKYGTQPDHYPAVGECLMSALARYATSSWGRETEDAWVRAYTRISQIMIDAAAENEAVAPAWWQAEVVSHELRTSDTAVVTVRPDQPYPFRAGQYTSLETPWWPRVWRHYSFAAAPRSDGLLSFHVKAVPAGWVSNALVHRARPGDVLRLGAPTGSMTVDHSAGNGLLCVGGGTGIAPIKALVEDIAGHGAQRPVDVFYGARSDHDLYDIDTMLRLEQTHPWLTVRPVVAVGPGDRGGPGTVTGQLPDAVRKYGPYREYDAYLSGPPGLIRSGVEALMGVGVPAERIRHDSIEELVSTGD